MTDDQRSRRLTAFGAALAHLQRAGEVSSLHDWCKKAGVGWSTANDFLEGRTQAMSDRTYAKLAGAVGWTVQRLKGEPEPISLDDEERDLLSRFRALSRAKRRSFLDILPEPAESRLDRRSPDDQE